MRVVVALVCSTLAASCRQGAEKPDRSAETVYRNSRTYTVDAAQPWADAFAIRDGRFVAVGSDDDVATWIGDATEVIDLGGRFVMPGIQDAHVHTQMVAEFEHSLSVDPGLGWDAIAQAIRSYAAEHADRQWILGGNLAWLETTIGASDAPAHRATLDALAPEHAVALWDVGGHAMLANSRALELVGIDRTTPDPPGGTIEHDAAGEPSGVLRELATNLELGERRLGWAFPARELPQSGARIAVGSDWPVVFDPNPFPALEALVTRERPGGSEETFGAVHAIPIAQAIRAYTLGSAYDLQQEESTGSIEVGKLADFIVLDRNLLEVPIREVHDAVVERTVLAGEVITRPEAADD